VDRSQSIHEIYHWNYELNVNIHITWNLIKYKLFRRASAGKICLVIKGRAFCYSQSTSKYNSIFLKLTNYRHICLYIKKVILRKLLLFLCSKILSISLLLKHKIKVWQQKPTSYEIPQNKLQAICFPSIRSLMKPEAKVRCAMWAHHMAVSPAATSSIGSRHPPRRCRYSRGYVEFMIPLQYIGDMSPINPLCHLGRLPRKNWSKSLAFFASVSLVQPAESCTWH
jgi:hypothetical protein